MKKQVTERDGQVLKLRRGLAATIDRAMGREEIRATEVPGLILVRHTQPNAPCRVTYEPSVAVIAQGRKRVELGQTALVYDESHYLLTSLDVPIVSQILEASEEAPFLALVLKLEMGVVRELIGREEVVPGEAAPAAKAVATGEITAEFLDACCRLVELLERPEDIPFLSGLIQRELIYRILRGGGGARLRAIATQGDQSQRTAKAMAWIKANYAKPLKVEELARLAGMGVSTLHHHFRALTDMSPLQYQKQLRLHAARGRMLANGLDAASAAFEVGYESASQFSREYRRFFGQPPGRDVRGLKESGSR